MLGGFFVCLKVNSNIDRFIHYKTEKESKEEMAKKSNNSIVKIDTFGELENGNIKIAHSIKTLNQQWGLKGLSFENVKSTSLQGR